MVVLSKSKGTTNNVINDILRDGMQHSHLKHLLARIKCKTLHCKKENLKHISGTVFHSFG